MLAVDRASDAAADQIDDLVDRILREVPGLYQGDSSVGQTDWRPIARDQAAWLRLSALNKCGRLNDVGQTYLAEIKARQRHLDREFEDSDLFSVYTSGVRQVVGDPAPLLTAEPAERLNIAHDLQTSRNFDDRESWAAYSATDPESALETLLSGDPVGDASLWTGFFNAIVRPPDNDLDRQNLSRRLLERSFEHLKDVDEAFLRVTSSALIDGLISASKLGADIRHDWWDRLWRIAESEEADDIPTDGVRFYQRVINSLGGRLAEHLLLKIDHRRKAGAKPSRIDLARMKTIMRSDTPAGHLGRGALVNDFGFVWSLGAHRVQRDLVPWLHPDTAKGAALRAVLVDYARLLQPEATRAVKDAILRGVQESDARNVEKRSVAAKLLYPVLCQIRGDGDAHSGLTSAEVRRALSHAKPGVREGAASCLRQWVGQTGHVAAEGWRKIIRPLFEATWPADRACCDEASTHELAALCVGAGDAFPEALALVMPFLTPFEQEWPNIGFLGTSNAPELFPRESLELIWKLCGPSSQSKRHDLAPVLDRITRARPELSADRRFQWLEDRGFRR
jgi:hypothetical protein